MESDGGINQRVAAADDGVRRGEWDEVMRLRDSQNTGRLFLNSRRDDEGKNRDTRRGRAPRRGSVASRRTIVEHTH